MSTFPPQPPSKKEVHTILAENERIAKEIAKEKLKSEAFVSAVKIANDIVNEMKIVKQYYDIVFNVPSEQEDLVIEYIRTWLGNESYDSEWCVRYHCTNGTCMLRID